MAYFSFQKGNGLQQDANQTPIPLIPQPMILSPAINPRITTLLRASTKREGGGGSIQRSQSKTYKNKKKKRKEDRDLTIFSDDNRSSRVSQLIQETDQFLKTKHPILSQQSSREETLTLLDFFLVQIDYIINTVCNVQTAHQSLQLSIGTDSRQRFDSCKAVIDYLAQAKDKVSQLNDALRSSFMSSNIMREEINLLRQRLDDTENQKKEDLMKKLYDKEQECLEYKVKLDKMAIFGDYQYPLAVEVPQTTIDVEYSKKITDQQQEFLMIYKQMQDLAFEINSHVTSVQGPENQEATNFSHQMMNQIEKIKQLQESFLDENTILYNKKVDLTAQVDSLINNTRFLEDKIATLMTQKEEQIIKLKSEMVIYKNKINNYKNKLKEAVQGFETKKLQENQAKTEELLAEKNGVIDQLDSELAEQRTQNREMREIIEGLEKRIEADQQIYQKNIHEQNILITELSERLKLIDEDYNQQLSKVDNIRDITQKRLNLEEKEKAMNSLKLEYLMNNYRKLQLQKRFLEKTLDKDMQNLANEMRKAELEIQKDSYISAISASNRIKTMYDIIKEALRYVKEVVGFMNFDIDQVEGEDLGQKSQIESKEEKSVIRDPLSKLEKSREEIKIIDQIQAPMFKDTPNNNILSLDQCFYKHIYELAEVLLSVLSELYKESRTQTSVETMQLFDKLQAKTDKRVVNEIYTKFFAQNRIHFAQFLNKLNERNYDLQQERNDLKVQVHRLNNQIKELFQEQEKDLDEDNKQKHQEQEAVDEELNEQMKEQQQELELYIQNNTHVSASELRVGQNVHKNLTMNYNQPTQDLRKNSSQTDIVKDNISTKLTLKELFSSMNNNNNPNNKSPAAVASVLFKSQERRVVDLLLVENNALKERVKETRLTLQRQIQEIQDQMRQMKDLHQFEMHKMKLEYGRDLGNIDKTYKMREEQMRIESQKEKERDFEKNQQEFDRKIQEIIANFNLQYEDLKRNYEKSELIREVVQRELKKLKKQSTQVAKGGWGTFAIVFEDGHKKYHPLDKPIFSNTPSSPGPTNAISIIGQNILRKLTNSASNDQLDTDNNDDAVRDDKPHEISPEKLQHFIEVGFLMDQKNFKHLDTYKDKTYDSILTKHLYEFQDPIDNFKMVQLQNKIKQQLSENFALFNEINPVYVTLNLGRTVSPFYGDDSQSQEQFRLVKREGFYLNGENYIMVNFLKCEEPQLVIRIIAFDNENCLQYSLDLIFEDLMLLVDGNMKLLEDECINDLCQIILNNLTMIKRKDQSHQKSNQALEIQEQEESNDSSQMLSSLMRRGRKQNPVLDANGILAVEHKLFFNEHYRNDFDQRNKIIFAKHDKRKKGMIQEKSIGTDFEKSIVYEAFDTVYEEKIVLQQTNSIKKTFNLELLRGRMSEHMILKIHLEGTEIRQELSLYQTPISKYNQSQQIAAEIIKIEGKDQQEKAVAYVFSIEKIYAFDHFMIKIVQVEKYDSPTMTSYSWSPNSKLGFGSLNYQTQVIYLVKKMNNSFMRIPEYEILNTELRSILFMQAYSYELAILDFGNLKALQNVNMKIPLEKIAYNTMNLIYRDFGVVRIKINSEKIIKDNDSEIERLNYDEEEEYEYQNNFAIFAFYDDFSCLNRGEIFVYIRLHGIQKELAQKISINDVLTSNEIASIKNDREKIIRKLFDQIIINKESDDEYVIVADKDSTPMSELIENLKKQKFQAQIDEHDIVETELDVKSLQINLNTLAECPKLAQISIINRKLFKITCYFVKNLKTIKPQQDQKKVFDWQIIYVDAQLRRDAKNYSIALTEKDLIEILDRLKASEQTYSSQKLNLHSYNEQEIINTKISKEKLLEFVLDCIVFDEVKHQLKISISHLRSRIEDRQKLEQQFKLTGARFITRLGQFNDPDLAIYKSSLPQIELNKKIIINVEKEFSDKKYDIKIFELSLKNLKNEHKYQFEMFCVDQPHAIFRVDFLSQSQQQGKKFLLERFNIIQQMHQDYEETKFVRDGMVLGIVEQSFPHSIKFMLLEPASHMQWSYEIEDDKLNQIESRNDNEYFVKLLKNNIESGLISNNLERDQVRFIDKLGYLKENSEQNLIDVWQGNLKSLFNDSNTLIYAKNIQIQSPSNKDNIIFAECMLISERQFDSIKLIIVTQEKKRFELSFSVLTQRESSRILSGFINFGVEKIKLVYIIETACAYTQQERAIRLILKEPLLDQQLLDAIITEKHLLANQSSSTALNNMNKPSFQVKDEIKFAFNTGFKDFFSLFQKLPDIITDFKRAFIEPEKKIEYSRPVDTSKLLYRKVIQYMGKTFIIFLKYDSIELAETQWRVILYEQSTEYEESFTFSTALILTKDEYNSLNAKNDRIMKDIVTRVVDRRLKIKAIEDKFSVVKLNDQSREGKRYMVYFIDPPQGVADTQFKDRYIHEFDIRNGFRFSFTNTEALMPESSNVTQQERIISQLEKDDLLFDISEILDPYELILRIKIYQKGSLKMISVSDIKEFDIKRELLRDRVSHLIEPQKREELAKYLVQNTYYDENKKRIFFLKSHVSD